MRILMMVSWYSPKGEEINGGIFHYEQALSLNKLCNIAIYYPYDKNLNDLYSDDIEHGLRVFRSAYNFKRKIYNRLNMYQAMKKIVKDYAPELIHAQVATEVGRFAIILGKSFKIPVIVTEHSTVEASGVTKFPCSYYAKFVFKNSKCNICVSDDLNRKLKLLFPLYDFITIYNGISLRTEAKSSLSKYRIDGKINIVLVAGLYDRLIKGVPTLLRVIRRIHKENKNVVLHIVGDGVYRKEFEELAKALDVSSVCYFHGQFRRIEVQNIMQECDFLVSASIMESFGCSIAEAQMLGKPVVATRCGGPESIVTDKTGILVDVNSEEALYLGIKKMISQYKDYNSEEISKYAKQKFSIDNIAIQYYKLYQKIIFDNK